MIAPWYAIFYHKLDKIAWRYGYCLSLHGSMMRDLDIIAIPWVDDAESPEVLLKAFCKFIGEGDVDLKPSNAVEKPHGRMGYTIPIGHGNQYLDISIMPKKENNDV